MDQQAQFSAATMNDKKMGPYRLERTIGSGGMGTVFRGIDERTGDKAAIKVLAAGMAQNEGLRERFQREIETLLQLRHPNIVRLFGFGEEEGELFYAMELVDGRSLAEIIVKESAIEWRRTVRYAREIAVGLRQAHDMGIIHRDIKPANILVTKSDKIKILDFGIARLFGSTQVTAAGGIVGTADYMAPEQAFGEGISPKADLYSLGAVMYAMLSRQPPFRGSTVTEILDKLRFSEPTPIDRLAKTIPNELSQLITQLLEKDPNRRIPTATAVCRRLDALLEIKEDTDFDLHLDRGTQRNMGKTAEKDYQLKSDVDDQPPTIDTGARVLADQPTMEVSEDSQDRSSQGKSNQAADTIVENRRKQEETPATKFVTVAEQRKRAIEENAKKAKKFNWKSNLQIIGMVAALVAIGVILFLAPQERNADTLHSAIKMSAENGDLASINDELDEFIQRFPEDPRIGYVQRLQNELQLRRQENRYKLGRMIGQTSKLEPVEQWYVDIISSEHLDEEDAIRQLQALVMIYGGAGEQSPDIERCLKLAERRIAQLKLQVNTRQKMLSESVVTRLAYADRIATTKPDEAKRIYQGTLMLLRDYDWAANIISSTERKLEGLQ